MNSKITAFSPIARWIRPSAVALIASALAVGSIVNARAASAPASSTLPEPLTLTSGWLMQDVAQVKDGGDIISKVGFAPSVYMPVPYVPPATASANPATATKLSEETRTVRPAGGRGGVGGGRGGAGGVDPNSKENAIAGAAGWPIDPEKNRPSFSSDWVQAPGPSSSAWYKATVPGTVLTTLVDNKVYPDPLYGENNRPNIIPESLSRTSYWYRNEFTVPASFAGKQVWLNFEGINYFADIWINGTKIGDIKGAFIRGNFDITKYVKPGEKAAVAVFIIPPPHPGDPWEKTVANMRGPNGGGTPGPLGLDGPTFVASIGWDWVPGIRDRQMGIWQNVTVSTTGPVLVVDPYVTTDLPLPSTASADVSIETRVQNTSDSPQTGVVSGKFGDIAFQSAPVTIAPKETQVVKLTPQTTPALHLTNPKLWWPNGLGDPYLYPVHLSFDIAGTPSDAKDFKIGVRTISYFVDNSTNLTLTVNGVPVFAKGGDWGMDDAMKRVSPERLDALVKLHQVANYNIIRNWVGQATSEAFYQACDKYGIMIWNDFYMANPSNGQAPADADLYMTNIRDTVLRFRNHASIAVWCGRNEGNPPATINTATTQVISELDPARIYQPSSASGNGASSNGGGYSWRTPLTFYNTTNFAFNTECGTASIPNLESIQSWMPKKDWFDINFPNDDWAEHDFVNGAGNQAPNDLQTVITSRYGPYNSLPEFVRKAQMANYEDFRAMYESREAHMFQPCTAIITWMSNPAQPCFVWQVYDYSLEPFSSFFAVQKACEPVHIEMTQDTYHAMVINNTPKTLDGYKARIQIYNLDGTKKFDETNPVASVPATSPADIGQITPPAGLTPVCFIKLDLLDPQGKSVSDNFYWAGNAPDDLKALDTMPDVQLDSKIVRHDAGGQVLLDVTLTNNGKIPAVMAHVQLRRTGTEADPRVLPVNYTANYVSLLPGESKTLTIEAAAKDLQGKQPLVVLDGWNTTVKGQSFTDGGASSIATNMNAYVKRTPAAAPVAAN